jgi:hypothetical protein
MKQTENTITPVMDCTGKIRPFELPDVPQIELNDLKRRILDTRWPKKGP